MKAVFKREFKAYFSTVIGWIFLAAFFFVFDIYFVANNISYGSPYISYATGNILFIFIIIMPVLAMRSMADDRRTKTDQLLYTSPVSIPKVIFGKYLALVAVFSIAMAAVALTPLFLSIFGDVPLGENYVLIFGVWLYGCFTLAICLFISSLTESQVIAAVLSFAVLFIGYLMDSIVSYLTSADNFITRFLSALAIASPLDNFGVGIFDVPGTVYYVSGIILFLFLTCQVVQKYRWSVSSKKIKTGVFNSTFVVIGIAITIAVNVFVNQLPDGVKNIDMTADQLYSLTDDTYTVLEEIDTDITLYVLCDEDDMDDTLAQTLERYDAGSDYITVTYIDPAQSPTFYTTYTDEAPTDGSIIVVSEDRSTVVDYDDVYEYSIDYSTYTYSVTGYDGEGLITSALIYVVNDDMPVVYTIEGHDEVDLDSDYITILERFNIEVESMTLLEYDEIPEDTAAIIIFAPLTDFSEDDAQKVIDYLASGGKAFIVASLEAEDDMTNFESILAEYDIGLTHGMVFEDDSSYYYQYPYYLLPDLDNYAEELDYVDGYVFMPYCEAITDLETDTENLEWTTYLTTSEDAYLKSDVSNISTVEREEGDEEGEFLLAAMVYDSETGAEVTIFSSPYIFTESADDIVSGNNVALFKGIVEAYANDTETTAVTIDMKDYVYDTIAVSSAVVTICELLLLIVLPVALLVIGIFVWLKRKRI